MLPTAIIAFREFLEAFLIIGVFLGISRKLKLKKEIEIGVAAAAGISISLLLSGITYSLGDSARVVLTKANAEILGNYLLLFSGFFLAYVVFSLHKRLSENKKEIIKKASEKLEKQAFDFSLFTTVIFLVSREGFEIALFTASTSLFSVFFQNLLGLLIGLILAAIIGSLTFITYTKFPIRKVFRATEYMVIFLGAAMVQVGITETLAHQFNLRLGNIISFNLNFLPSHDSIVGHFIRSFAGVDSEFSLPRLLIMIAYIGAIYAFVGRNKIQISMKS